MRIRNQKSRENRVNYCACIVGAAPKRWLRIPVRKKLHASVSVSRRHNSQVTSSVVKQLNLVSTGDDVLVRASSVYARLGTQLFAFSRFTFSLFPLFHFFTWEVFSITLGGKRDTACTTHLGPPLQFSSETALNDTSILLPQSVFLRIFCA